MAKPPADAPPTEIDADFPEDEIARRRDEVTRRLLNTPYKAQDKTRAPKKKKGKAKAKA
ncbi:MAG TPA: hypothetical protein PLN53_01080 [Terricaulis sp.]|nr:hypothetical protein [Terricaulis sp.]